MPRWLHIVYKNYETTLLQNLLFWLILLRPAIHLSRNTREWAQNAKNEKCIAEYFTPLFSHFAPIFSLFAFCSNLRQCWHSHENSKDFMIYFFATLIKHEICMKCKKCMISVSYFVVCIMKNTREMRKVYSQPYTFNHRNNVQILPII